MDDDDEDLESTDSEEEDELNYDGDDDKTTFDKVVILTEQTLETLWKYIVK